MFAIYIFSILGLFLSIYAFYVERKHAANAHYHALCDINTTTSCSKAFSSQYGKMLGIPNSIIGIGVYTTFIILTFFNYTNYLFYLATLGLLGSLYLAYALFIKLKIKCIVCISIYVVNLTLFIIIYLYYF